MSVTASVVSVGLLFDELRVAIQSKRIEKLKDLQFRLSVLVKQFIKTDDLAALTSVNQKSMELILTTDGIKSSDLMIIFGWKRDEVEKVCFSASMGSLASISHMVAFSSSNVKACEELGVPFTLLGRAYLDSTRSLSKGLPGVEGIPDVFAALRANILSRNLSMAKYLGSLISNLACYSIISGDMDTLSSLIEHLSRILRELFTEKKFIDILPVVFDVDHFSMALVKESFSKDAESLFVGVALHNIYDTYGRYAFKNMEEFNDSYRTIVSRLSTTFTSDLFTLEEGESAGSPHKSLLLSFFGLWHLNCMDDVSRCSRLLKEISTKFASGEMEYSKFLEALGSDEDRYNESLASIVDTKDEVAIAIGVAGIVLRDEMFVSSKLATPKTMSERVLNIVVNAMGVGSVTDIISMAIDRAGAWAAVKPLSLVDIKPIKFIIGSLLKLIVSAQDISLLLESLKNLHTLMITLYRAGEKEAVTKLLSDVPFDFKCGILESLKLDDGSGCLKAMADAVVLEGMRDDIREYELLVEENGSYESYKGKLYAYHTDVKAFHREVYSALGLPETSELADIYIDHESMCAKQMKKATSAISSACKADVEGVDVLFDETFSTATNLDDFIANSAKIRKLSNYLISNGKLEEYVALVGKVKDNVERMVEHSYDRAVIFVSILQLNEYGYKDPLEELSEIVAHSLDVLSTDQNPFMMMMISCNQETYYEAPGSHPTSSIGLRMFKQKALESLGVLSSYVDFARKNQVKRCLDELCADTGDAKVLVANNFRIVLLFKVLSLYSLDANQASVFSAALQHLLERHSRSRSVVRELAAADSLGVAQLSSFVRGILETPKGRQLALTSTVLSSRFSSLAFRLGVREGEELIGFKRNFLRGNALLDIGSLISDLEEGSTIVSDTNADITSDDYIRFGAVQSAVLYAYASADAVTLAEMACAFTHMLQKLNAEGNYRALALLASVSGSSLENLIITLESGRLNLVHFHLFQNIGNFSAMHSFANEEEVKRYAVAFTEEVEDYGTGCDLLPIDSLERELVSIEDVSATLAKAIILETKVRLNQAFLEKNITYYAKMLNILKNVLLARSGVFNLSNEILILNILELRPEQAHGLFLNVQAGDEEEIIRQLNNIFLENSASTNYGSIVSTARRMLKKEEFTKAVLSHMGITIVDVSQPFRLVSNAALLDDAVVEIAAYIRDKANKGVSLSSFKATAVAAKLEKVILALATPVESDTDRYREVYLALNRAYLDHVLAHRFGIGGSSELYGLEYDLDGSYTHTMVNEMQKGYALMQESATLSSDEFASFWAALSVGDGSEQLRIIAEIFSDIQGIELKEWKESRYMETIESGKPIALPTYTNFGEQGGHANGCVLFKKGSEYFAIFSDKGGDIELKDSGINVYRVGNVHLLKHFAKKLAESNEKPIPKEEFKLLKEELGLVKLHMIEKKPHKSGTCGYSSAAKTIAQGIQYARFYSFAIDKGIEPSAALVLAGEASSVFAKRFSLFDRREYLNKYIAECARLGVEANIDLLSRIRFSCAEKDKYRDIVSIIDDLRVLDGRHLEAAELELRTRVRQSMLEAIGEAGSLLDVSILDSFVEEVVAMYTRGYKREELIECYERWKTILKARVEGQSAIATASLAVGDADGREAAATTAQDELERERVVVPGDDAEPRRAQSPSLTS